MAKNYDQLVTDKDRHVNFRAQRHSPDELLGATNATVSVSGKEFALHDIAMNSLSFVDNDGQDWLLGTSSDVLLRINDKELYSGSCEVARLEQSPARTKVALKITDGFIDLPKLQQSFTALKFDTDLARGTAEFRSKLPREYMDVIYDFNHFLSYCRRKMNNFENEIRQHKDISSQDIIDLARNCRQYIAPAWDSFCTKAYECSQAFIGDVKTIKLAKFFTEDMITRQIVAAPLADRCYNKPLGYPGDYLSMLHIYEDKYVGDSAFSALIHKFMSELGLALGVRTRKDTVFSLLQDAAKRCFDAQNLEDLPFTATSLGCGPAIEISDFSHWLASSKYCDKSVEWTLIDQEERALSHAYSNAHRAIDSKTPHFKAKCVYMSFLQMLRETESLLHDDSQSAIYSVGLFDYLKTRQSQQLIKNLFKKVRPGGRLIICNAVKPIESQWFAEYVLDWSLNYRTKQDMINLAKLIDQKKHSVNIVDEPSNAYHFLTIDKGV